MRSLRVILIWTVICAATAYGDNRLSNFRNLLMAELLGDVAIPDYEFLLFRLPFPVPDRINGAGGDDLGFLDVIPQKATIWSPSGRNVTKVYASLFDQRTILAERRVSEREVADLEKAERILFQPQDTSLLLRGYRPVKRPSEAATAYFMGLATLDDVFTRVEKPDLVQSVIDALIVNGVSSDVRHALMVRRLHEEKRPSTQWADMRQYSLNRDDITFTPPFEQWMSTNGWFRREISVDRDRGLAIQFLVKRVAVRRDWLDERVFRFRFWKRIADDGRVEVISHGTKTDSVDIAEAVMPLLPVEFFICKEIRRIGETSAFATIWLPPCFTPANDEPFILGVGCRVVPKNPNPDPDLLWSN